MVLFLIKSYHVRKIFHKIIELKHSTIFFSQMNAWNQTIKQLNYEVLPMNISYTQFFNSLILIFIITFFDVRTKLNNHILQCSDIKYTCEIKPLQNYCQILHSSNVFFKWYQTFKSYLNCNQIRWHTHKIEHNLRELDITWFVQLIVYAFTAVTKT